MSRAPRPARGRLARLLVPALLLSGLASCLAWTSPRPDLVWDRRPAGVNLSTTPAGAAVVIDGVDSGFATPCIIDLDEDDAYRIEFELDGYQTAGLYVTPDRRWFLIPYVDTTRAARVFRFPLWMPFGEFWLPVRTNTALSPSRIHLRLRLGADEFDGPGAPPSAAGEGLPLAAR